MIIAGAASLTFPGLGYLFEEGLVSSKNGLVCPFDKKASGTVFGDSVGAVVMKRLADAERDGDTILAVIKGYGNSNDGQKKASFSAPSAYGKASNFGRHLFCLIRCMILPDFPYVDNLFQGKVLQLKQG